MSRWTPPPDKIIVPGHAWIFFRIIELIGLLSGVSTKTKPECQLFVIRSKSWMFRKRLGKCADLLTHAKDRNRGKHIWSLASGTHFSKRSLFHSLPLASQATESCWSFNERERHAEYVFSGFPFSFSDVAVILKLFYWIKGIRILAACWGALRWSLPVLLRHTRT